MVMERRNLLETQIWYDQSPIAEGNLAIMKDLWTIKKSVTGLWSYARHHKIFSLKWIGCEAEGIVEETPTCK